MLLLPLLYGVQKVDRVELVSGGSGGGSSAVGSRRRGSAAGHRIIAPKCVYCWQRSP